jgi:hypothetical protein
MAEEPCHTEVGDATKSNLLVPGTQGDICDDPKPVSSGGGP